MSDKVFLDCLGRQIKVGDVLANGQRRQSHGGIQVGIVTGFTAKTILANMVDCDHLGFYRVERLTSRKLRKGHFNADYNCCITGLTEDALKSMINLESEEKSEAAKV